MKYKIVRIFRSGRKYTVRRGLSLEEAQQHCSDPETSSSTATGKTARARTLKRGAWFDAYDQDR